MTNIINLNDRRKSEPEPESEAVKPELTPEEQRTIYVQTRKNLIDFLTSALVTVNTQPELTEAVVFLKDPERGMFLPGATSQETLDELLKALGSEVKIPAMPKGDDE